MFNYRGFLILLCFTNVLISSCGEQQRSDTKDAQKENLSTDTIQSKQSQVVRDTLPTTSIKWLDSTFRDMGSVKNKKSLLVNFRFKNTGDKPLIVQGVRTTCGCTTADTLYKPVMPGKESAIRVKFNSAGQAVAVHEKHVYVITNTRPYPGTTLTFKVEVKD